jgi:hypothetical protein
MVDIGTDIDDVLEDIPKLFLLRRPKTKTFPQFLCKCGGKYTQYNKKKHELTKKHRRYLDDLEIAKINGVECGK